LRATWGPICATWGLPIRAPAGLGATKRLKPQPPRKNNTPNRSTGLQVERRTAMASAARGEPSGREHVAIGPRPVCRLGGRLGVRSIKRGAPATPAHPCCGCRFSLAAAAGEFRQRSRETAAGCGCWTSGPAAELRRWDHHRSPIPHQGRAESKQLVPKLITSHRPGCAAGMVPRRRATRFDPRREFPGQEGFGHGRVVRRPVSSPMIRIDGPRARAVSITRADPSRPSVAGAAG